MRSVSLASHSFNTLAIARRNAAKRKDAAYHTRGSRLSSTLRANNPGFRFPVLTASIGGEAIYIASPPIRLGLG